MDLNKLRVFASIYEKKSVTAAAEHMNVTASAVSQSLKSLESEAELRLFQRISKRLHPTPTADSLYKTVSKFIRDSEVILKDAIVNSDKPVGHLKIGAPSEFGSQKVINAVAQMTATPGCSFSLHFALPDVLTRMVANSELDIAFCDQGSYLQQYEKSVLAQVVFREEAVLVCTKAFYKKHKLHETHYHQLIRLDHIDYREDAAVLDLWYQHHFGKSPKIKLRLAANNVRAIINAAKAGIGLAFIPTYLIEKEIKSGKLIVLETDKKPYQNPIMMVQHQDKIPSKLEREFVKLFYKEKAL